MKSSQSWCDLVRQRLPISIPIWNNECRNPSKFLTWGRYREHAWHFFRWFFINLEMLRCDKRFRHFPLFLINFDNLYFWWNHNCKIINIVILQIPWLEVATVAMYKKYLEKYDTLRNLIIHWKLRSSIIHSSTYLKNIRYYNKTINIVKKLFMLKFSCCS